MKEANKLGALNVAVMYVGAIMGAGFASGRETWQFFGVFGDKGRIGAIIFAALFMMIGFMVSYIARKLGTNDMGKVIVPGGNEKLESFIGNMMAVFLMFVMVVMSAAGGALLHQQFGLSYATGGVLVTILVIVTVIGDFERISKVFKYIMPVLCIAMVGTCIAVISMHPESAQVVYNIKPSPVAPNWPVAALLYTCYNVMALIAIVATASINAKSEKIAVIGTGMGGVFLGILAMLILITVQCDMVFSQATDMPVLGYANKISRGLGTLYTLILFFAIYSAATSNFYGFTTKLKEGPHKKKIIIGAAVFGAVLGQIGFTNIVKYVSPATGYVGIIIVIMLICNFISVWKKERRKMKPEAFPRPLTRVTGGPGGEAVLIEGGQKTVLHDCGMACFHEELIENLEKALGDKPLDYVILSHSHYDHMGALPYIIKRWPNVKVCGGKKAAQVFQRPGAVKMIASMGKTAAEFYGKTPEEAYGEGLRVDIVLESGDILDLGEEKILAFETKGHTDCSMSYLMQPQGILLASESTGVMDLEGHIRASILKSFDDSFEAAALLKLLPFKHILVPHFGILPAELNSTYFDMYTEAAEKEKTLIEDCLKRGLTEEETLEEHKKVYWNETRAKGQPYRAYEMNTKIIISLIAKNAE